MILGRILAVGATLVLAPQALSSDAEPARWQSVGRLDPELIQETSGIVQSRHDPEVFWAHPDSGNAAKLVAFRLDGQILAEVIVDGAPNIDWEDICADDAGHLYIGDLGNNTGMLPVRYVYQVKEPDPHHPPDQPIEVIKRWRVRYPDDERFNCESLVWRKGELYALGRTPTREAQLYRLAAHGADDHVFTKVGTVPVASVAGADVSSDGQHLVVCNPSQAVVIPWPEGEDAPVDSAAVPAAKTIRYRPTSAMESCCFAGNDLVLVNEGGQIYHVSQADVQNETRFLKR